MKTKIFLCMRPPVTETDNRDYIKLPPKVSSRRNRDFRNKKRVAPEKYICQLPVNFNGNNRFSNNIPENKPLEKDSQKGLKTTSPISDENIAISFSGDKSVCLKKVNGGPPESNSGVYLMASSLFFTIVMGKFFGILCTLILVCSFYPYRKNDVNDGRRSINMVVNSPEKGSPEELKKKVIMEGLLERKNYNRENIKFFS